MFSRLLFDVVLPTPFYFLGVKDRRSSEFNHRAKTKNTYWNSYGLKMMVNTVWKCFVYSTHSGKYSTHADQYKCRVASEAHATGLAQSWHDPLRPLLRGPGLMVCMDSRRLAQVGYCRRLCIKYTLGDILPQGHLL